jgi:hypothetical protein
MVYFFLYFFQIGLAGNLRDYVLISHTGEAKKGSEIYTFDGLPVGYTSSPIETVWLFFFCIFQNNMLSGLHGSNVRYTVEIFVPDL